METFELAFYQSFEQKSENIAIINITFNCINIIIYRLSYLAVLGLRPSGGLHGHPPGACGPRGSVPAAARLLVKLGRLGGVHHDHGGPVQHQQLEIIVSLGISVEVIATALLLSLPDIGHLSLSPLCVLSNLTGLSHLHELASLVGGRGLLHPSLLLLLHEPADQSTALEHAVASQGAANHECSEDRNDLSHQRDLLLLGEGLRLRPECALVRGEVRHVGAGVSVEEIIILTRGEHVDTATGGYRVTLTSGKETRHDPASAGRVAGVRESSLRSSDIKMKAIQTVITLLLMRESLNRYQVNLSVISIEPSTSNCDVDV